MKTKEEKQQENYKYIVKNLEEGTLSVSAGRVIFPLTYLAGRVTGESYVKLALNAMSRRKEKFGFKPTTKVGMIMKSVNKDNVLNIMDRYDINHNQDIYVSLQDVKQFVKGAELNYSDVFKSFTFDRCEYPEEYFIKKDLFFKYMPIFKSFTQKTIKDMEVGYCCDEHDGPLEYHLMSRIEYGDIKDIKDQLDEIEIKYK